MSQEERRDQILKTREENKRTADRIEQGTVYHEPVTVWFTDRTQHPVEVHAINGRQFREACRKAGIVPDPEIIKKPEKLLDSLDFLGALAEVATESGTVEKLLGVEEEAKIAIKAFELMSPPKN